MDESNKTVIHPSEVWPVVRMANYFTVPPWQSWPRHSINDLELVLVVSGEFSAQDDGHPFTVLTHGDILLIRSGHPCSLLRRSGSPAMISCIHFELSPEMEWSSGSYRIAPDEPWVVSMSGDHSIVELFRRCAAEFNGHHSYRLELMTTIMREIWLRIMGRGSKGAPYSKGSLKAEEMTAFIQRNIEKPLSRNSLAVEFGISAGHVTHLFQANFGVSPVEYINRKRVQAAARLISSRRHSIAEVAFKVGFNDPLYFSRVFHRIMGMPPSRFG